MYAYVCVGVGEDTGHRLSCMTSSLSTLFLWYVCLDMHGESRPRQLVSSLFCLVSLRQDLSLKEQFAILAKLAHEGTHGISLFIP